MDLICNVCHEHVYGCCFTYDGRVLHLACAKDAGYFTPDPVPESDEIARLRAIEKAARALHVALFSA